MTSTVSFKEKFKQAFSIFKWELKSCTGTLVVFSILAAVFMTIILTLCLVIGNPNNDFMYTVSSGMTYEIPLQVFQILSSGMIYFLTIIFTIIYTVKVYSYLHNKRKADLYGSLPVSRVTLFFSKSASAFIFSLFPALFFLGIMSIISICAGQPLVNEATQTYLKLVIGTLSCISAYGLISICCGTTINSVIMFIAVCVAYPLSAMFVKGVAGGFFYGSYSEIFKDHFIMNALNPLAAYDGINVIYWIIFTLICIAGSAFLVRKRKAERAQSSFAYYLPCHIVKVLVSFLAGMFLGVLFGSLNVFGYGLLGFVFGFILGSIPAFTICHLIFYKGFSKLVSTSIPLGGLIIAVIVGIALCDFDVFGYNTFIPNSDDVESAGLIDTDYCYYDKDESFSSLTKKTAGDFDKKEDINTIINFHQQYIGRENIASIASNEKFSNVWYDMLANNMPFSVNPPQYCFAYRLTNGMTVTRIYTPIGFDSIYSDEYYFINTTEITSKKEYVEKYSAMERADISNITTFTVDALKRSGYEGSADLLPNYNDINNNTLNEQANNAKKVLNALKKDFAADKSTTDVVLEPFHSISSDYYDGYSYHSSLYEYSKEYPDVVCMISIWTNNNMDNEISSFSQIFSGDYFNYHTTSEYYFIPKSYTNTINVLKEIGVLNDDLTINENSAYFY